MKQALLAVFFLAGAGLAGAGVLRAQQTSPQTSPQDQRKAAARQTDPTTTAALPAQFATGVAQEWNEKILESAQNPPASPAAATREYRIGPEDLIEVTVFEVPELSRTVRVSAAGEISLPLVGAVKAAGLSPIELEQSLTDLLRKSYVKDPQVSVFLKEYRSDPVSVVGAVKAPGLYQIQTERRLIELLAMAQGFSDNPKMLPGRNIVITRKAQPAAGQDSAPAKATAAAGTPQAAPADPGPQIQEIPIRALLESGDPKWDVPIYPGDVIKVVPAGTFYVAGDVNQPGGFALADFDDVSSIQAVAMAGGTKKTAKLKDAIIIRRDAGGNRMEQKVDLKGVLEGKAPDVRLGANDILFVPGSVGKEAGLRGMEAAIQVATGVLIWGL
jgi:polysaccharide biosynthesis/export protein